MAFFRLAPPKMSHGRTEPGSVWINTDHIVRVVETRRSPPDESLELSIFMVGERDPVGVNEALAGKGVAEKVLAFLESQRAPSTRPGSDPKTEK